MVPGGSLREAGVRAAGALAELGITRARLVAPGGASRELAARETDLPGVLVASPGAALHAGGVTIRVEGGRLTWEAPEADAAGWAAALAEPVNPA